MNQALNIPVRKSTPRIDTGEQFMQSRNPIVMPDTGMPNREDIVPAVDGIKSLQKKYLQDLAFAEEPVTIRISHTTNEKNPPQVVDCWVNGIGAEILVDGKWRATNPGCLPIGRIVTTKRKYVEQLMRCKRDQIETIHEGAEVEQPRNTVRFNTNTAYSISIVRDTNPASADWQEQIMYER